MQTKQKANKIGDQSKKIKKPIGYKFGALVQDKVSKKARVLDDRKNLIQEYRQSKNKNEVHDKRFLKKREPDSKLIQNLERKRNKKSIFNLDSDNEEENGGEIKLTHKGVDVDLLNDYKEDDFDKEASDDENINARLVNDFHFEGFDDEGEKNASNFHERKKTKQEIYKELIHKSKKEKFLRQQAALELQEKVQELDDGFGDIVNLLMKNPDQYKDYKRNMSKNDSYLALTSALQEDRRIKPEAENTVDPNREDKKKKRRRGDEETKEEDDDDSEYGDDVEIVGKKKKNRKMKDALKKQDKTNKLMGFLDDIKAAKKAESDDDNDLDEVDLDDEEDEDGEDGEDDDELDEEDVSDDDDLDDEDEY